MKPKLIRIKVEKQYILQVCKAPYRSRCIRFLRMSVNLLYFRLWRCETCEQFGSCGQKHHTAHRLLNSLKSLILSVFTYHYMIVYSGVGYTIICSKYTVQKVYRYWNAFVNFVFLQDLKSNVRKIADFLELNHDEEFINNVAEKCTFKNMKNGKESNPQAYWKDCTLDGKMPIFRKGTLRMLYSWRVTLCRVRLFLSECIINKNKCDWN